MQEMRAALRSIAGGLLVLAAAHPAVSDPLEEGRIAFGRSEYRTAYTLLAPLADEGAVRAQMLVAEMLRFGLGVEVDTEKAALLYRRASLQGYVPAQYALAVLYLTGVGVERSVPHAIMWLTVALDVMGFEEFVPDSGASVHQPVTALRRNIVAGAGLLEIGLAIDMAAACLKSNYKACD
jgi:hypothetical protein